jgi:hypothetical protein
MPSTGLSVAMHVVANARPFASVMERLVDMRVLLALAVFHNVFKPGTAGGTPPGPAGTPTSAVKFRRMSGSVFCLSLIVAPYLAAPSAAFSSSCTNALKYRGICMIYLSLLWVRCRNLCKSNNNRILTINCSKEPAGCPALPESECLPRRGFVIRP